jgi:hypothetical protein
MLATGGSSLVAAFADTFLGHQHNPVRVLLSMIYDVSLPLFVLGLFGGIFALLQRNRAGVFHLLAAVIPLALLVLISPFTQAFSRYVFATLPSWIILAALAAKELLFQTQKSARILAAGVLLLAAADPISQDVLYYTYQSGNRPDWKGAFAVVEANMLPGDQIMVTRQEMAEYYLGNAGIWIEDVAPKDVVRSGKRTWFVVDNGTGFVTNKLQAWLDTETRLVSVRDVYLPGKPLTMRVYLYDPAVLLEPVQP